MSGTRLFAIFVIFVLAAGAWLVLAGSIELRTQSIDDRLGDAVGGLWGAEQIQSAPDFLATPGGRLVIASSDVAADFSLQQLREGLLWYATYVGNFDAAYQVRNPLDKPATTTMSLRFPDASAGYDGLVVTVDGTEVPVEYREGSAHATFAVARGATAKVETGYRTNGTDRWTYVPSPEGAGVVRDFNLAMTTDLVKVDYPPDSVSPTSAG